MKKQRFLLFLMTIIIAVMLMPTSVFAWEGNGTETSPYLVSSVDDLEQVRNYPKAYFRLTTDITLTSAWSPIGNEYTTFEGVFDGNNKTISGLAMNISGGDVFAGLFGYSEGVIKNLNVKISGITVSAKENAYVGGIVGYNNRGSVTNCYAEGSIIVNAATNINESNVYVGMIAGNSTGAVSDSSAYGSINAAVSATTAQRTSANPVAIYAGGIVGLITQPLNNNAAVVDIVTTSTSATKYSNAEIYAGGIVGETSSDIEKCFTAGNVYAESTNTLTDAVAYAGGIAGKTSANTSEASSIADVTAVSNATGTATYAGGLIGYNTGAVTNSYAKGVASAHTSSISDAAYAGGLIGLNGGNITSSYATGLAQTTGNSIKGGLVGYSTKTAQRSYYKGDASYTMNNECGEVKTDEELKSAATYPGWDFTSVWTISTAVNNGNPSLKFMPATSITLENAEYTYDKTEKTITATNIGAGVSVIYKNNKATKAGAYTATVIEKKADNTFAVTSAELKINKKTLTAKGIVALEKDRDGTTVAQFDASGATLEGIISGDEVIIDTSKAKAEFASADSGENIPVTITGIEVKGKDAGNYQVGTYTTTGTIKENYTDVVYAGSGTKADPYKVSTELELNAIRIHSDKHFKLTGDISLKDNFRPIETFSGSFDGDGHTISGIKFVSKGQEGVGLFAENRGTIENVTLSAASYDINSVDMAYIGIVAGLNKGTISNVKVLGSVVTDARGSFVYVGGITGKNEGTVVKSVSEANITAEGTNVYAGGAIGDNRGSVEKTYAVGNVVVNNAFMVYAGGFVGASGREISNSYATGNATANVTDVCFMINVGGFAGRIESGKVNQSYSLGAPAIVVSGAGVTLETAIGGFAAINNGTVTNCLYNSETSGQSDIGKGQPKTTAQLKNRATYAEWNFADWIIDNTVNSGYPSFGEKFGPYVAELTYDNGTVTIDAFDDISNAYLIIVSYYDDLVVDYDLITEVSVAKGKLEQKTVKSDFEVVSGGKVKAMLWKDILNIKPLASFVFTNVN